MVQAGILFRGAALPEGHRAAKTDDGRSRGQDEGDADRRSALRKGASARWPQIHDAYLVEVKKPPSRRVVGLLQDPRGHPGSKAFRPEKRGRLPSSNEGKE